MSSAGDLIRRPATLVLLVAVLAFGLCVAQQQVMPTVPMIQDEFSYLLAADTFSEGRLTNPPHVLRRFFDAPHILLLPTYQSKYPPGQGLALAVGQVLTGSPLVGVWISFAAACAAVCWMLQSWLPLRWAFLGGVLAATNAGNLHFWGGTFFGGSVAMLGGALLFGGLARSLKDPRPRNGIVLAVGALILAITRPYEGLIASLPAAAVLVAWSVRQQKLPRRLVSRRLLAPIAITLTLGACWLGYYNYRVTGSPIRMPYQVYMEQHGSDVFTGPHVDELGRGRFEGRKAPFFERFWRQAVFHLGGTALYAIPLLLTLPWLLKSRWGRFALVTSLLTLVAAALTWGSAPHYSAPIAALVVGLLAQSVGMVAGWMRWRIAAFAVVVGFLGTWLLFSYSFMRSETQLFQSNMELSHLAEPPVAPIPPPGDIEGEPDRKYLEWFSELAILARQEHVERFEADPDRHLILVRYIPGSTRYREWVYNRADIDRASSVWAWWTGLEPLWPLITYFKDRRVWYIVPERDPWAMLPFPLETVGTWYLRQHAGTEAAVLPTPTSVDPVRVDIIRGGVEDWHLQIERAHPPLEQGRRYVGNFTARADASRSVWVDVSQAHLPWWNLGLHRRYDLTEEWKTFQYAFVATSTEPLPRLVFNLGGSDIGVELSQVELEESQVER